MSSGPTATGETCIEVTKRGRINIDIRRKDWCRYEGKCEVEITNGGDKTCDFCIHKARFNIPEMIRKERGKKNVNINT